MDQSNAPKNRLHRRSNVLMTANLELSGVSLPVRLRNLSADGALVEAEKLPVEGASIVFRKGDIAVPAHMAWVNGRKGGVSFTRRINEEQLLRHIPLPRKKDGTQFRRPALKEEPTANELDFAHRWIWGPAKD